jgi:hypothetical protein
LKAFEYLRMLQLEAVTKITEIHDAFLLRLGKRVGP